MSQRLPTPGGDSGTWGDVLNAYLGVVHAADGTLNALSVPASALSSVASGTTATSGWVATADGSGNVTYAAVSAAGDKLGLTPTAVKTSAYTAVAGDFVPVDTTSAGITVTLPNAPANGSVVAVKHVIQGSTNTVTLACAGSDVFNKTSGPTAGTLVMVNQGTVLQYKSSGAIWYSVATDTPLSGLDTRYAASTFAVDTIGSGTDITTNNVTSTKHGLAPKSPADAAQFLNGAATPAFAAVTGAQLSMSDVTTNNATSSQHGFLPKLDSSATKVLLGDGTWGLFPLIATNVQTANYTAVLADAGKVIEVNVSSACTITIPTNASVAYPIGTVISVFQQGAGQVTFTPTSGATILSPSSKVKLTGQYSSGAIRKQLTDTWVLAGDLA